MINSQAFLKKFKWQTNGRLFGFGTSPEADWKIIFMSTIILVVLVIFSSAFMFIIVSKGETLVVGESSVQDAKSLDTALLKETVLYYQNKALEFERIKSLVVPSVDPSL